MKQRLFRSAALVLALLLLLGSVPVMAVDSEAYGTLLHSADTQLHQGVVYSQSAYWSDFYKDLRQENYFTYTPGTRVIPRVVTGSSVSGRLTGDEAAAALEAQGYRVVAAINGDYFESAGTPIGLEISDGRLFSSDMGLPAVGFTEEGKTVIGKPALTMTLIGGGTELLNLTALNKIRSSGDGIFAYTYDFNDKHTTGTVESGVEVVLEAVGFHSGPAIGKSRTYRIVSVTETAGTAVAEGQLVLSVNHKASAESIRQVQSLQVGSEVTLRVTAEDERWNEVVSAVGGLHILVEAGKPQSNSTVTNGPRTAVGVREDGTAVFYTVDGRQGGYSIGASLTVLGQRMAELGCVEAICLDGGGSTTAMATMPDSTTASLLNRPSDGAQRKVSNVLVLTASGSSVGWGGSTWLGDPGAYILPGASVELRSSMVDSNYIPVAGGVSLSATAGTISGGIFTAPEQAGEVTITASGWSGSAQRNITVVDVPDEVTLSAGGNRITSLTLNPGAQVQLTGGAKYNRLPVIAANSNFSWTASPEAGSVDETGLFVASRNPGSGTLTVSFGEKSLTVPVSITTLPIKEMENFEGDVSRYYGYGVTLAQETAGDKVHRGKAALRVDYSQDGTGAAIYAGWSMPAGYDKLVLSVYGDGSGNSVAVFDNLGRTTDAFVLDFTGWKQVEIPMPEGAGMITALIIKGWHFDGTVWLDQAVASYGDVVDTTGPVISGDLAGTLLTVTVKDEIDGTLEKSALALTVDGAALDFAYTDGVLTATLPEIGAMDRRITLTARDNSGNLSRVSWDQMGDGSGKTAFSDMIVDGADHWATPYIQYLCGRGVITGYSEKGALLAKPDKNLTRGEFAVMLYRWMGLKEEDFAQVQLPFVDQAALQEWMLPAARAMYALGIIQGSSDGLGNLTFDAGKTLTRAQAMTMLGRIQEKGYATGDLESFADGGDVPAWAGDYLKTMTAQGVLNGIGGNLYPNRTMTRGQAAKVLWAMG